MSSYGSEFKKEKNPLISLFWKMTVTAIGGDYQYLALETGGTMFTLSPEGSMIKKPCFKA
jgi:hypothetical protein